MPKIAEKAKALNGKGVVFSYICEPQKFYFRELIPGTKRYRSRLIEGAETIEEALSGCIDAYTALCVPVMQGIESSLTQTHPQMCRQPFL